MHLLLTNDDGISSPFLAALVDACRHRGHRVTVCAPSGPQSTSSHRYTTREAIAVHPMGDNRYAVDGTPVDCVRIALRRICPGADAVLSGVNLGWNTGLPVYASGTVGAAREAVLTGVRGIALSAEPATPPETLHRFLDWALTLTEQLPNHAPLGVWNLNAPCVTASSLLPPVMAPLQQAIYADDYAAAPQADGSLLYRMHGLPDQPRPEPGCDLNMLRKGHITATLLPPDAPEQSAFAAFLPGM